MIAALGCLLTVGVAALDGESAGFVVHEWGSAKARGFSACPEGRSLGYRQIFEQTPEGRKREGEGDKAYAVRAGAGGVKLAHFEGKNLCAHPELASDPHFKTMDDRAVISYGIDLDGKHSRQEDSGAPGSCAHNDFAGIDGVTGIDNQYLRLTGCSGNPSTEESFSAEGWLPPQQEALENTMLEGGWGVLIEIKGIDDYDNDDSVEVGIYANADPIVMSARREPIPYATYAADQDARFRATTRGKIVDGVLTTEPVNVRFHWLVAGLHLERPINHARLQARIDDEGVMEGYLAGYTPVDALYDLQYGFRSATNDKGEPANPEMLVNLATLAASAMNRTCNGAYEAMYRLADGDPDPETGRCTSLSTQYFFRATPAFVVDVQTRSLNDALLEGE